MTWFDAARTVPTVEVARALGMTVARGRTGPCPSCSAERTGTDSRPPVLINELHWKCVACQESGDGIDLAARLLVGTSQPAVDQWQEVREWYSGHGWLPHEPSKAVRRPAGASQRRRPVKPAARPPEVINRLPAAEVQALWRASVPVADDTRAARWLQARADDPRHAWGGCRAWFNDPAALVASLNLVRALPQDIHCPDWATMNGSSWSSRGYSLVIPCLDARGQLAGIRARWTGTSEDDQGNVYETTPAGPKALNPTGSARLRGTVYACRLGRQMLQEGCSSLSAENWNGQVLVVEGIAFLLYAVDPQRFTTDQQGRRCRNAPGPAVFGVWSGSWTDSASGRSLAGRLQGSKRVVIATDGNQAGDKYARDIAATLESSGIPYKRHSRRTRGTT